MCHMHRKYWKLTLPVFLPVASIWKFFLFSNLMLGEDDIVILTCIALIPNEHEFCF